MHGYLPRRRLDCGCVKSQQQRNRLVLPEGDCADQQGLPRLVAEHILLEKGRSFLGQFVVAPDDGDGTIKPLQPELERRVGATLFTPRRSKHQILRVPSQIC